ncbi:MAG: hypothetical protein PHU23_01150 [Dehalococcoidales bacterium]|nr:hypothetical protein [Dehalococcoidales bacterium]
MQYLKALSLASQIVNRLSPYCSRIEIAGSIRRKRPFVNDIDLVCIPSNQGSFAYQLQQLGSIKMGGQKIIRVQRPDIDLDIYIATLETWATLLLIRTGSKEHNIYLCKRALSLGMKLHADGRGLERCLAGQGYEVDNATTSKIDCETEESIFQALGLKYMRPEDRN